MKYLKPHTGPKADGGKLSLMAHADNWVMCRHPGCMPLVMMTKEWNVLPDWSGCIEPDEPWPRQEVV